MRRTTSRIYVVILCYSRFNFYNETGTPCCLKFSRFSDSSTIQDVHFHFLFYEQNYVPYSKGLENFGNPFETFHSHGEGFIKLHQS